MIFLKDWATSDRRQAARMVWLRVVGTAFIFQKIYRKMAATFCTASSCAKQCSGETYPEDGL